MYSMSRQVFVWSLVFTLIALTQDANAWSAIRSDVGNYVCWVAENFEGNAGRGMATVGISTIGVLALLGRITWTQAMIVGIGCSALFGAPAIVANLGGSYC